MRATVEGVRLVTYNCHAHKNHSWLLAKRDCTWLKVRAQASAFGFKAWSTDLDVMDRAEGWVWGLGFEVCGLCSRTAHGLEGATNLVSSVQ